MAAVLLGRIIIRLYIVCGGIIVISANKKYDGLSALKNRRLPPKALPLG